MPTTTKHSCTLQILVGSLLGVWLFLSPSILFSFHQACKLPKRNTSAGAVGTTPQTTHPSISIPPQTHSLAAKKQSPWPWRCRWLPGQPRHSPARRSVKAGTCLNAQVIWAPSYSWLLLLVSFNCDSQTTSTVLRCGGKICQNFISKNPTRLWHPKAPPQSQARPMPAAVISAVWKRPKA